MLGEVGHELNAREASVEASLCKRGRMWLRRPFWSNGQQRLTAVLRRCPAPGVERPTRPTHLAYAERGNPVVVWNHPVTPSQERAKSTAGTGWRKKRTPAAERHGESITRRIAPYGVPRKGADVRETIYPKRDVKELQPGGKVRCSPLQTSLLVTS